MALCDIAMEFERHLPWNRLCSASALLAKQMWQQRQGTSCAAGLRFRLWGSDVQNVWFPNIFQEGVFLGLWFAWLLCAMLCKQPRDLEAC